MHQIFLESKFWKTIGIIFVILFVLNGLFIKIDVVKPNNDTYQAVFLTNGQVYFGKLTANRTQYVLRDVFYIQAFDPRKTNTEIKLVKFGDELHGPEDEMVLERSQVGIWENLRLDSRVLQGILAFNTRGPDPVAKQPTAEAQPAPTTNATKPGAKK